MGVLDKSTMQMKVHNAQLFNMLPTIPGKYVIYGNSGISLFSGLLAVMENIRFIIVVFRLQSH